MTISHVGQKVFGHPKFSENASHTFLEFVRFPFSESWGWRFWLFSGSVGLMRISLKPLKNLRFLELSNYFFGKKLMGPILYFLKSFWLGESVSRIQRVSFCIFRHHRNFFYKACFDIEVWVNVTKNSDSDRSLNGLIVVERNLQKFVNRWGQAPIATYSFCIPGWNTSRECGCFEEYRPSVPSQLLIVTGIYLAV